MRIIEKFEEWVQKDKDSEGIKKAIKVATDAHKGQVRKIRGSSGQLIDYIIHPLQVAELVNTLKNSHRISDLIKAAVLHDTVEDTELSLDYIKQEFGELVYSLVKELTNDEVKIKEIGKEKYMMTKLLDMTNWGLVIKLCDRLHNMSDLYLAKKGTEKEQKWAQKYATETINVINKLKTERKLTKTQKSIIKLIEEKTNKFFEEIKNKEQNEHWTNII